jgi:hypothetical protein
MSDVPTNGAQSIGGAGLNTNQTSGARAHEIEDIDRELEEYLREKRSGNGFGYADHSVDEQLAKLREKFGARVSPTKESEKPREVEVIQNSPHDEYVPSSNPTVKPATAAAPSTAPQIKTPQMSHEDLIRSLEEKYSKGESTNLPPQATLQSVQKESVTTREITPILVDLKESIDPLDPTHVEELLSKASTLSPELQSSLVETLLARFKRNKERKELYTKTQKELENELELFIRKGGEAKGVAEQPLRQQAFVPKPDVTAHSDVPKSADVAPAQEKPVEEKANVQQQSSQTGNGEEGLLRKKFERYLSNAEKKPVVLVYEPENGFVRKVVDPNDSTLKLAFSVEVATNTVVLIVSDIRGNELGVFKIPQSTLDN